MGLAVVEGMQGPHTSAYWKQEGSHTPDWMVALHLAGQVWTQGPQISVYCSQEGSHWPVLTASLHLPGHVGV